MRLCEAISPRYQIRQQNKALLLAQPAKTSNKLKVIVVVIVVVVVAVVVVVETS